MRNIDGGEKKKREKKKSDENTGPLTLLPVNHLNGGACNADAHTNQRGGVIKKNADSQT